MAQNRLSILGILFLGVLLSYRPGTALTADQLQDVQIVGHHFTTGISSGFKTVRTKDPSRGRYVVLKVAATAAEDGNLFAPDFVLVYDHRDGTEDRAMCDAIGRAETPEPGEFVRFAVGDVANISMDKGRLFFGLAFWIEPDVDTIYLHRINTGPIQYRIGSDRQCSVCLVTNNGAPMLSQAREVIQAGGYDVVRTSQKLAEDTKGVTIHYQESTESYAREISQRMIARFDLIPKLEKMDLATQFDVVVWLGK